MGTTVIKVFESNRIHTLTLCFFLMGKQLFQILLRLCDILSNCRQKQTNLFWEVYILLFRFEKDKDTM